MDKWMNVGQCKPNGISIKPNELNILFTKLLNVKIFNNIINLNWILKSI
jgi:hypothetical protein